MADWNEEDCRKNRLIVKQADAPAYLKDYETEAVAERVK